MSDMTELFMRDPLELTDEDITKIIEHYRAARATFKAAPASVKRGATKTASQKKATSALNIELKL